ncbi:sulfite exporter TauE/SafE family protein [Candidatus Protochlamydia phocaeensis]|uniref:sulfite exporter TauE/SafE family protein n=1 Tax=Candidatus Protochlamydia phocaeensis TaxID=1414722 RepID=UPI000838AD09|nr:sulfite exporter TauE/SafE family protein [Candidatus Protochlamydia phocaeensis]
MAYSLICATAFFVSILTLFSGFGLGTVLMPVFAIFFPLPIAIAATGVVHLANNIFKAVLVGKWAKWSIVFKFGLPAAFASALGAYLLGLVSNWPSITTYHLYTHAFHITPIGLIIGVIVILSSFMELIPRFSKLSFPSHYIPVGGALSGFFGGISGYQGTLRSAFLIKAGLKKEEFIGTGVICSIIVDVIRIAIYGWALYSKKFAHMLSGEMRAILIAACLSSFIGSYLGARLVHRMTFKALQIIVGIMLLLLGAAIVLGIA